MKTLQENKFYQENYKITLQSNFLDITVDNAKVGITLQTDIFKKNNYYKLKENVVSQLRINSLYSRVNKEKPRAPKNLTRKMLCYGLLLLIKKGRIHLNNIISLEADPSDNNNLINKVYIPMGFTLEAMDIENEGGLMSAKVSTILNWCESSF